MTQEELARQSGLSVRALSDIERGHTSRPYARTVRLLADALKLDEPARARLMSAAHDGTVHDSTVHDGTVHDSMMRDGMVRDGTVRDSMMRDGTEDAAGQRAEWIARWREAAVSTAATASDVIDSDDAPTARVRRDHRSRTESRRARRAYLAAASAATALAGCVVGWASVNHSQTKLPVISRPSPGPAAPVSEGVSSAVARCDQGTADLASSLVRGSNGTFWGTVEVQYSYRCASVWTHFDPSPAVSDSKAVMVTLEIINRPDGKYQVSSASGTDQPQGTDMLLLHNGCAQGSVILLKLGREVAKATTTCQAAP